MLKLSEIKGDNAIDVIADILEPVAVMLADKEVEKTIKSKVPVIVKAQVILKRQKKAILEILAILNQVDPKEFNPSLIELPVMLMSVIQDIEAHPELKILFQSQGQMTTSVSSGAVMEPTQGTEEI